MNKRSAVIGLALAVMLMLLLAGCGAPGADEAAPQVTLTIAGGWTDCRAIEAVGRKFTEAYPNCTIVYEYLQDYYEALPKRMTGDDAVDLFFTTNIQEGSDLLPFALDLNGCGIDFSQTFGGLIENFTFREAASGPSKLYAVPLGAEMRGLYINKTLLESQGVSVPTDQASFLAACEALKQKGYIPCQGNPSDFGQTLLYPWICSIIANASDPQAARDMVNARKPGLSELFREPFELLYALVENGYYDYKKSQTELALFSETSDEAYAGYFFNIDIETHEKLEGPGQVAFMPSPMSMRRTMDKTKEDYHSDIEYLFVPAPVSKTGGFAYLSPAHGIAANKNSANTEWSEKFLNFLFQPENNRVFAEAFNIIPNTKEAFDYISKLYDIPSDQICELGQVTFDYGFYDIMQKNLVDAAKANNPKYMREDGAGGVSLYPLEHYMSALEESLTKNGD